MIMHKCLKSGCNVLIKQGDKYCAAHTNANAKEYERLRKINQARLLTFYKSKAWRKLRASKLATSPICEECEREGKVSQATTVHHIRDVRMYWNERLEFNNLESLCKSHHEQIYKGRYFNGE